MGPPVVYASPKKSKKIRKEDQMEAMRLSFLEKKLVERSRFRNLEETLKNIQP